MSPKQIARNMERVQKLRRDSMAYFFSKPHVYQQMQDDADRVARATAAALRQSDYWAPQVKESLLAGLERN